MFFSISAGRQDNFPDHYILGDFFVDTDSGWTLKHTSRHAILYKGYVDCGSLDSLLESIIKLSTPYLTGNFCILAFDKLTSELKVLSSLYRSFPLFFDNGNQVTNLVPVGSQIWADNQITILPGIYLRDNIVDIIGNVNEVVLPAEEIASKVDAILNKKTQQFVSHNQLPIRVFLSGGVDTMLVYSYLQKFTDQFELVKCQHVDFDYFYLSNSGDLAANWGYQQIHHWTQPCILTSGAPGDEFMIRSPTIVGGVLKHRGIDPVAELSSRPQCMHWDYFRQSKHLDAIKNTLALSNKEVCNIIVNDWQHWHIGNTLTWAPLRDLEIAKLIMQLPLDRLMGQIFDSEFSCQLIEKNLPGATEFLSDRKNTKNYLKNLVKILL